MARDAGWWVTSVAIGVTLPGLATAQSNNARVLPATSVPTAVVPERAAARGTTIEMVVPAPANALSVVRVPVPGGLGDQRVVTYEITPIVDGAVVGQLSGSLAAASNERSVLFAIRSPRFLAAGRAPIALVHFSTTDDGANVSVIADVPVVRGASVALPAPIVVARAAAPVTIPWRLTNSGNVPDTFTVSAVLPQGWTPAAPVRGLSVPPRRILDGTLTVTPPPSASGIATVRLLVQRDGAVIAEKDVDVQFAGGVGSIPVYGPTLRVAAAAAAGPWPGASTLQSLELHGPITDGIRVLARATTSPSREEANYAFSRVELPNSPAFVQVFSEEWRVNAGTLGTSLSDLTGTNLIGRGGGAWVRTPTWSVNAIAAEPSSGALLANGSLAGTRVEYTPGDFSFSTGWSHLRERRGATNRELDAWSLGGGHDDILGGRMSTEFARRVTGDRAEPGWSATYDRRTRDDNVNVRYVHAPGGSSAFARATNEFALSAGKRLSRRVDVHATAWRTEDNGLGTVSTVDMEGWSLGAQAALQADTHLSLDARHSAFGASTSIGSFGSAYNVITAAVDLRRGLIRTGVAVHAARLDRTGVLVGGTGGTSTRSAPNGGVRATLGTGDERRALAITGRYERTGPGIGASPIQWSYGAEVSGIPPFAGDFVRVEAALEHVGGSIETARAITMRAGVDITLPLRSTLRLSAERNPYAIPTVSGTPWVFVAGLTKAVSFPRLATGGTQGRVYRDLNGNGRRDRGEPGLAGVALRRGGQLVVSDERGAFRIGGNTRDPIEADVRSLPIGWLLPSATIAHAFNQIGVVPVAPLSVVLAVEGADLSRVSRADVGRVEVSLRDSTGWAWTGRRASDSTIVFDALPPGKYQVDVDATGAREPLTAVDAIRSIEMTTERVPKPVRIVLRTRQLKFSNQGRRSP